MSFGDLEGESLPPGLRSALPTLRHTPICGGHPRNAPDLSWFVYEATGVGYFPEKHAEQNEVPAESFTTSCNP
jgi:hypothetical protein